METAAESLKQPEIMFDKLASVNVGRESSMVQPGDGLDGYRVGPLFGHGGMSLLYLVEDPRLPRLQLVMKVLAPGGDDQERRDMVARMEREAQALSAASKSRYVVRIHGAGRCPDGTPYIVEERLAGMDLKEFIAQSGTLEIAKAVEIAIQACLGLHVCHSEGVIHRDIKPANVFLHQETEVVQVVKLIDFGISHVGAGPAITSITKASGTLRYMPLEQMLGRDDERVDQFSLAVVLFEILTGELPWPVPKEKDREDHARLLARGSFRSLRELRNEVPHGLERVIGRALSTAPEERFVSMYEFARDLLPYASPEGRAIFSQYVPAGPYGGTRIFEPFSELITVAQPRGGGNIGVGATGDAGDDVGRTAEPESEYVTVPSEPSAPFAVERHTTARPGRRRVVIMAAVAGIASAGVMFTKTGGWWGSGRGGEIGAGEADQMKSWSGAALSLSPAPADSGSVARVVTAGVFPEEAVRRGREGGELVHDVVAGAGPDEVTPKTSGKAGLGSRDQEVSQPPSAAPPTRSAPTGSRRPRGNLRAGRARHTREGTAIVE
jgi:Protein kinase domain